MEYIVEVNNLKYKNVFTDFQIKLVKGQIISIAGSNNCGKSTLIKILAGLIPVRGKKALKATYINKQSLFKNIGFVFPFEKQTFLFDNLYDELVFVLENLNYSNDKIDKEIKDITILFGIDKDLRKEVGQLSASKKVRFLLSLALIHHPTILFLDDSLAMLSKKETKEILEILKKKNKDENLTIVMATNNLEETLYSDYLYVLHEGKIAIEGRPIDVMMEDSLLTKLGLELPFMVDLSLKLKFYDILDDVEIDMDRMVNKLWK